MRGCPGYASAGLVTSPQARHSEDIDSSEPFHAEIDDTGLPLGCLPLRRRPTCLRREVRKKTITQ